jgi:hypothetical protein
MRLIPVGGPDIPALEILFRSQVCLGQQGSAERDTWFPADDHDRPAETLLTQVTTAVPPALPPPTITIGFEPVPSGMHDILVQPRSAKRGTMGITDHSCFVPGQLVPRNRRSSVTVEAIGPGREPRPAQSGRIAMHEPERRRRLLPPAARAAPPALSRPVPTAWSVTPIASM